MINEGRERAVEKRKDAVGKRLLWGVGRQENDEGGRGTKDGDVEEGRKDAGGREVNPGCRREERVIKEMHKKK